MDTGKNSETR